MRAELALVAALTVGACGAPEPPYAFSDDEITVVLSAAETVSLEGRSAAKRIELTLRGTPSDGRCALSIVSATWEHRGVDGYVIEHTSGAPPPEGAAAIERARTALLTALQGSEIVLAFDPANGVTDVSGTAGAVAAARTAVLDADDLEATIATAVDAAADGAAALLDDKALLRALAAAGFGAVPETVLDPLRDARRTAEVHVDGLGLTRLELRGRAGMEADESPVVQMDARTSAAATFEGEAGPAPPPSVGDVLRDSIIVHAETMYRRVDLRPLRGNVRIEHAHTRGARVERRVSFTLVSTE